jgi:hypothetical protein
MHVVADSSGLQLHQMQRLRHCRRLRINSKQCTCRVGWQTRARASAFSPLAELDAPNSILC